MREIEAQVITQAVADLAIKACCVLPQDVYNCLKQAKAQEPSTVGQAILNQILLNSNLARDESTPICQDTGLAVIFIDVGQNVRIVGGDFEQAIHEGVRRGYTDGYLRKSCVAEPLFERENTKDNTPAIIHTRIVPGDEVHITLAPKGAGSENKSILKMLVPADGIDGVRQVVLEAIKLAGPNACPPLVVGVGIGGNLEMAAICAKRAAVRDINSKNPDPRYAALEEEFLEMANKTGIGPQGLGGKCTALRVHIEWYPTHIASLPVAVNINCNAVRHAKITI